MGTYEAEKKRWDKKASTYVRDVESLKLNKTYDNVFSQLNTLKPVYEFFRLNETKEPPVILDFGCGAGWSTLLLSQKARLVYGFDLSFNSIKVLNQKKEYNEIGNILAFKCNAEHLPFKDGTFDYVFGNAILHHLDLELVIPEISRILKPGGRAAFCEPFGHNPVVNLYRYIKDKYVEKVIGIHCPVTYEDRALFNKYFSRADFVETSFLSDKSPLLRSVERFLLENIKITRNLASYVTILLEK